MDETSQVPKPVRPQHSRRAIVKTTYNAAQLAEQTANALIAGKGTGLKRNSQLGQITERDRELLQRITGQTVEEFNVAISQQLRTVASLAASRIIEKLHADEFKPSELGFVLSVAEDKRTRLDGSHSLANASVNIQVNNYGTDSQSSKDALLAGLNGQQRGMKNVTQTPIPHDSGKNTDCAA